MINHRPTQAVSEPATLDSAAFHPKLRGEAEAGSASSGLSAQSLPGLPWQVSPDALARVRWNDPQHRRGALWLGASPESPGHWLDVVPSDQGGFIQGRLEQAGSRFLAITETGLKGPLYHQTLDGHWSRSRFMSGLGQAMFSSERSRFYTHVIEIACREGALHEWCDTVIQAVSEHQDLCEEIFMQAWNSLMDTWDPVGEPRIYSAIDRLLAHEHELVGTKSGPTRAEALHAIRDTLIKYHHLEDSIRDALTFLRAARQWWATRAELETPIQERIGRLVQQRVAIEADITREREQATAVMAALETALAPVPSDATRAVLKSLCFGWSRHFDLINGGFIPTPGVVCEGMKDDLQRLIQSLASKPGAYAECHAARSLFARLDEHAIVSHLIKLRTHERVAGALVRKMVPSTREERAARLNLCAWRVSRQQIEQQQCREVLQRQFALLFSAEPPHVDPQQVRAVVNHIAEVWSSFAEAVPGLNYQPELSISTGLEGFIGRMIQDAPAGTSEEAFEYFRNVMLDPNNLAVTQNLRHALYMSALVAADRERTGHENETLVHLGQLQPRQISAWAMLQAGPPVLFNTLQEVADYHPQLEEVGLRTHELERYQHFTHLFMQCRDPSALAAQCRAQIMEDIQKHIDQTQAEGVLHKVAEATALTRFLIDHFADAATFNADMAMANTALMHHPDLPPSVVQSLEAWRKGLESSFVNRARDAAKATARWYMSAIEEKLWYLVNVMED